MDSTADGKIDLNEFLRLDEDRRTAFFKKLDANADGSVTAEEFQAFAGKHHRRQRGEQPQQQN
jgi:hypothetical protein